MKKVAVVVAILCLVVSMSACSGSYETKTKYYNQTNEPVTKATNNTILSEETIKSQLKEVMDIDKTSLTAKDVQFDMPNQLDKKFGLYGIATLSDYYNYGFSDWEKDLYCIKIQQADGDDWYLYGSRQTDAELFNDLKNSEKGYVVCTAIIPSYYYEDGQGNLAVISKYSWAVQ